MLKKLVLITMILSCLCGCSNQSTSVVPLENSTSMLDEVDKTSKIFDKKQEESTKEQLDKNKKKEENKSQNSQVSDKKKEDVKPNTQEIIKENTTQKEETKPSSKPVEKPKPTPSPTPTPTPTPTPKPEEKPKACPGGMDENVACDIIFDTNFYYEKLSSEGEATSRGEYYLNEVVYIGEIEITNYSIQPVYRNDRSIAFYGLNLWSNGTLIQ